MYRFIIFFLKKSKESLGKQTLTIKFVLNVFLSGFKFLGQ